LGKATNGKQPDPENIRLFVFDLDGTLIDSMLDLSLSVNAVRERAGLAPLPHETIHTFIGDGARSLLHRALEGQTGEDELDDALWFFIRYYSEHALDHTAPYPGVIEGLERISSNGHSLAILTNKPARVSRDILTRMDLARYFPTIYGGNSFDTKKPDPLGLETILRECNAGPQQTLMVGDSPVDVATARNAGAWACGVTYGFHSHMLEDAPPDFSVDSLTQLADWANT
jgi:phosphoglycolate phosphatase